MAERHAEVLWEGELAHGRGTITSGSGALDGQEVSWPRRVESADGKTSPEELIAAAHAACFAMALSHELGSGGAPPESLRVTASVTLDQVDGAFTITNVALSVRGVVPGIDADGFRGAVEAAKAGCPVSKALAGGPSISAEAHLDA
jgi:osmotically inducible protein OsmC